jgi:hypothetical protein
VPRRQDFSKTARLLRGQISTFGIALDLTGNYRPRQLFAPAPDGSASWIGTVAVIAEEREVMPLRLDGLDFLLVFVLPRAEANHDDDLLQQALDTADAGSFVPTEESRLIKFHRVDARQQHFDPDAWKLPVPGKIFGFSKLLVSALLAYEKEAPGIEQFLFLPSTAKLDRFYTRIIIKLRAALPQYTLTPLLPSTGALNAYQKSQGHRREASSHERSQRREKHGDPGTGDCERDARHPSTG